MPIIKSILDTDFYKCSMQAAILACYPDAEVEYVFIDRRGTHFDNSFADRLRGGIQDMTSLRALPEEIDFLSFAAPFLGPGYLEYLRNYQFDPNEVSFEVVDGRLSLKIVGPWKRTVLWEVPLMAMISELHFRDLKWSRQEQWDRAYEKGQRLQQAGCLFAEFGSRRRRSAEVQAGVYQQLLKATCVGTSNPYLAYLTETKPIGTVAHEWFMAISVLEGLRHANRFSLEKWDAVYQSNLGTALPDTFTTDAFFADFDLHHSKLWDGLRHDSGCPFRFTDKTVAHYKKLKIDPSTKTIVFSDNLNVDKAIAIRQYCLAAGVRCSFGIGTHFTNDFNDVPALNIVIKLSKVNGVPVVKLSDDLGKSIGDRDALRVARWTFFNEPLDD